jgi:hypothetical protein
VLTPVADIAAIDGMQEVVISRTTPVVARAIIERREPTAFRS